MHLNTESRCLLKPHKLQSAISTVGLWLGSVLVGFSSSACFPDSIPRALGHTLASQLIFGWSDLGGPLVFPSSVAFGSCLILLSGSMLSSAREQKHLRGASHQVLYGRGAGGLGRVIHMKFWIVPYVPHIMFWEYAAYWKWGSKHCEGKKKKNLNWVVLSQARIS